MSRRFLHVWAVIPILLLTSVLSLTVNAQGSDHDGIEQFGPLDLVEMVFFPYVPHGDTIDDTGPWYGSITVQNLEAHDVQIWVLPDAGFAPHEALGTYVLPPNGSITLSSSALGLEEPGSPLVVAGVFRRIWDPEVPDLGHVLSKICDDRSWSGRDEYDPWQNSCKPSIAAIARVAAPGPMAGATGNRTTGEHKSIDGYNAIPAQDVSWGAQSAFCDAVVYRWGDSCTGIGTYEPLGYGIGFVFDGHSYLPIVQTNSGWNTEIRISNIDPSVWAGQVNVTLIASDQMGHASRDEHQITFETTLRPGESWALDLRQYGIPDGWVGSAHITSNVGVVAYAARVKPSDDLLMINVAAPSTWATTSPGTEFQTQSYTTDYTQADSSSFEMYAPLVFRDYHGWNTGISILNIDEAPNRVSVTWFDHSGTTQSVDVLTIPAKGQRYVYLPGSSDLGAGAHLGWAGAMTLTGDAPFHATVDQVKYETGEAMSYMATAAGAWLPAGSGDTQRTPHSLALPLIQKGQADGSGDTSGIQLFNPDVRHSVNVEISLYSPVGDLIPPTTTVPIRTTIRPRGHFTLYTLESSLMIPNSTGTAHVRVVGGNGRVYGVSNLVNYDVSGDGSTAYNLVNAFGQYRFPTSQTELP